MRKLIASLAVVALALGGCNPGDEKVSLAASAERTFKAYVTGYSWFDNTPPGAADISHPVLHQQAAGVGTYADPITVAVGHSLATGRDVLDFPAGTRFYIPNVRRYFMVEDTCGDGPRPQNGPCHTGYPAPATAWLDVWIDGRTGTRSATDACMEAITRVSSVIQAPVNGYKAVSGPLFANGRCTARYGDTVVRA